MFLKRIKDLTQGLRFRVAASYFVLVVATSIVLFGFLYLLLNGTLQEKDRRIIVSDFKKFSLLTNVSGADGLKDWFDKSQNGAPAKDVYVRLRGADGKTLFLHLPAIMDEFNVAEFEKSTETAEDDRITRVESTIDPEDAVEFYTDTLANGTKLQVGKDTDDREELLQKFRTAFAIVTGTSLLVALATAFLFSRNILKPIQSLISTVEDVRGGNLSARAHTEDSGDEINTLAIFLNGMLAQNSKLISALTESLDAVAHDLRTPLTRLRVQAERALQLQEKNPEERMRQHDEAFGAILENTDQVIELLNAIFDISESNAGTLALRYVKLRLQPVLAEVVDIYSVVAEEKKIELVLGSLDDVEFDADIRIKQAVANLIDNAIKFSPNGSSVRVNAHATSNEIVISVEDEGPGIARGDEGKIWDRLYRADSSRTTRGMGLGLSLVQAIVHAHHGTVSVAPAREQAAASGSRFEIRLPRLKPT